MVPVAQGLNELMLPFAYMSHTVFILNHYVGQLGLCIHLSRVKRVAKTQLMADRFNGIIVKNRVSRSQVLLKQGFQYLTLHRRGLLPFWHGSPILLYSCLSCQLLCCKDT